MIISEKGEGFEQRALGAKIRQGREQRWELSIDR